MTDKEILRHIHSEISVKYVQAYHSREIGSNKSPAMIDVCNLCRDRLMNGERIDIARSYYGKGYMKGCHDTHKLRNERTEYLVDDLSKLIDSLYDEINRLSLENTKFAKKHRFLYWLVCKLNK